jgi:HK97 family phage major capsid protein
MDPETKQTLDLITKSLDILTTKANEAGATETEIKALQAEFNTLKADVKAQAQKNATFNIVSSSIEDRKHALGCSLKAMHAARLAGVSPMDLSKASESTLKGFGYFGEERAIGDELMVKTMQASSDTSGGLFIPTQLMSEQWVDTLRPNERTIFNAGAKMFELPSGAGGIMLPRKKTNSSVVTASENGSGAATELTWEMITLKVRRATGYGPVSKRLTFSAPAYVGIFQQDILKTVALEMQRQAIYGKGSEGESCGIVNDPQVAKYYMGGVDGVIGASGKRFSYTDLATLEDVLASNDGRVEGSSFITHPKVIANMKRERVANYSGQPGGTPLFSFNPAQSLLSDKNLRELVGYDWYRLTQIQANAAAIGSSAAGTCRDLIFGQWDNLWVYTFGGIKITMSDVATVGGVSAFTDNIVWIKGDVEFDSIIRQPKELVVVPDCLATKVAGE